MSWILIAKILSPIIGLFLFFKVENARKSNLGINSNRVHCPNCQLKMPIIRRPLNEFQKNYGGWTCKKCGTMMNKWSKEVDEDGEIIP